MAAYSTTHTQAAVDIPGSTHLWVLHRTQAERPLGAGSSGYVFHRSAPGTLPAIVFQGWQVFNPPRPAVDYTQQRLPLAGGAASPKDLGSDGEHRAVGLILTDHDLHPVSASTLRMPTSGVPPSLPLLGLGAILLVGHNCKSLDQVRGATENTVRLCASCRYARAASGAIPTEYVQQARYCQ